jgi:hypothetical protein
MPRSEGVISGILSDRSLPITATFLARRRYGNVRAVEREETDIWEQRQQQLDSKPNN